MDDYIIFGVPENLSTIYGERSVQFIASKKNILRLRDQNF